MPQGLASRLASVAPSVTLAMNARAAELRSKGVDVFAFGVGEPDFEPPAFVLEAAKQAIDRGASKYTAVSGILPLREAVCEKLATRGVDAKPDQVVGGVGAKHALFNLALALYEPGDEVVIPTPSWISYAEQVRMMGATPVLVPSSEEEGFRISPAKLAAALTPKTKAVIFCTPTNPTGSAYSGPEMSALLDVLRKHDCIIVIDEIYADLVYDGFEHVSAGKLGADLRDRLVLVDGVAKSYAMTGWRIGWAVAPKRIAKALDTIQGQSTTNATAVAQHAAVAALRGPQDAVREMRDKFQKRRDVMVAGLNALGLRCRKPEGAFYAFADCRSLYGIAHGETKLASDEDVAMFLLDAAHVASVPGGPFGAPGYVRFSYATNEERIGAGLASVRAAVEARR